jgi:hypothetical protein
VASGFWLYRKRKCDLIGGFRFTRIDDVAVVF